MDTALLPLGTKDMDTILGWLMFAFVALAAGAVCFLLGRHHHRKRKARRLANHQAGPHANQKHHTPRR